MIRRKVLLAVAAAAVAAAGVCGTAAPALALGTVNDDGGYSGHSFIQSGTKFLEVQTLYNVTSANVRVCSQGTSAGSLITGVPKVRGSTNSFAQWEGKSGYYAPGGRHTKANGTTFNS